MKRFLQWLDRWVCILGTAHPTLSHVTLTHDHCPHCHERTLCEVNVLRGYQRCVQCGRRPHDPPVHEVDPAEVAAA
jgi:hypothetical protein